MNEIEKDAIEQLKKVTYNNDCYTIDLHTVFGFTTWNYCFETILNLIEKQQKEIENSISKDKIREKLEIERIKALDRFDNKLDVTQRIYKRNVQVALIDKLKKELLEEG